jgi:hypothetical protein
MKPEGSLPCSQQPATCSHPEARRILFVPFQSHCNITLPSMTRSSKCCRLITLRHQNPSPPYVPHAQLITLLSVGGQHTTCSSSLCSSLQSPGRLLPLSPVQTPSPLLNLLKPRQALVSNSSILTTLIRYSVRDFMPPSSGYGRRRFLASNAVTHLSQHPAPHTTAPSH